MIKWIAWERHRRTNELCSYLGIEPTIFESNLPRLIKHPLFTLKTISEIFSNDIETLIIQNPSVLLTLIACLLHKIRGYRLIIDTHNAGIQPETYILKQLDWLYSYFQREADITIVTNEALADIVRGNGGEPFIMPDRLPRSQATKKLKLKGKYNLVYICSFGKDEPYEQVIEAVKKLSTDYIVYITGNYQKVQGKLKNKTSDNIIYTGFLDEYNYWNLLGSCDLVIDLTNRENCLLCGAYEAISVGTPMILSSKLALMRYFYKGCIYTDNSSQSIIEAVNNGIANKERLKLEINQLREELQQNWESIGARFKEILYQ